jgi:acetyltransferase
MEFGTENLNSFFSPRAIAVIGASNQEDSLGAKIFRNLLESYHGSVFPINPFRPTVQGITAYSSVSRVPSKIDLAIIATPAHTIPQIVEECGKAKVQSIIIVSAGFSESDEAGEELTRQILEHKRALWNANNRTKQFWDNKTKNRLVRNFCGKKGDT